MDSTSAPKDRFCDLVMKGGIASGIVYPFAIAELAHEFRFRSIGGTSAGAVAAAVTAAAEYRRRCADAAESPGADAMAGFAVVQKVAEDLRASTPDGKLALEGLFAPDPGCERLFQVLLRTLSRARRMHLDTAKWQAIRRARVAAGAAGWDMGAPTGPARPEAPPADGPSGDVAGDDDEARQPAPEAYDESMLKALGHALLGAYRGVVVVAVASAIVLGGLAGAAAALAVPSPWPVPAGVAMGLIVAAAAAAAVLLAGIPWSMYRDIVDRAVPNHFGLCRGMGDAPGGGKRITTWLHGLVQSAAGRQIDDPPLTFGELWSAPGFPPPGMAPLDTRGRSIDLVMFTTNLSHGRPYVFPHEDENARLFYKREELAGLVPAEVMQWIDDHAAAYVAGERDPSVERLEELGLRQIPAAADFPVVLAARMSLSYPFLFSAVPLWAIDYEARPHDFRRCWFSDGGISSNFPMHLFDGFLPAWPTFGIDLESHVPGHRYVFLPTQPNRGYDDRWNRFDEDGGAPTRFAGFFGAVIATMQNWNDNTNARMPGVRDRIARVRLDEHEGGFNLDMPPGVQEDVADRGRRAARKLMDQFGAGQAPAAGWDMQRWSRLEVLVRTLQKRMPGVELALRSGLPFTRSYEELLGQATPPGADRALTPVQREAVTQLLRLIEQAARELGPAAAAFDPRPVPDPELRVRPPL